MQSMRRIAGTVGLAVSAILFAVQVSTHAVHQLNRTLRGPTAGEVLDLRRWVPERIQVLDLTSADRRSAGSSDIRAPLARGWIPGPPAPPRSPRQVLVFIDGMPVPRLDAEPEPPPETTFAYYRSRQTGVLLVRCAPSDACREAILARNDWLFDVALARLRLARSPRHLVLALIAGGLWLAVAAAGHAGRSLFLLGTMALVLLAWLGLRLYAWPWAAPLLALEALAVSFPRVWPLVRGLAAKLTTSWLGAVSPRTDAAARLSRGPWIAAAAAALAIPHVLFGRSWYPVNSDDSFVYLHGASRLLTTGSLLEGITEPSAWLYSAYPLCLAALSKAAAVHPMVAYRWLGYAAAALLPGALGTFAYIVTRRLRVALLACWVGALWAGLAGYVWLVSDGLPSVLRLEAPALIWDDYFEPRFLGEYRGPHSEITSYLCRPPFYPREAGLVIFWPALGLLYAGLPRPGVRRILAYALTTVLASAVYPYYGIPAVIALATVTALEVARLSWVRDAKAVGLRLGLLGLAAAAVVGLADLLIRHHKSPAGLLAYLVTLGTAPIESLRSYPSLRFEVSSLLGGHAFMLLAMGLGALLAERDHARSRGDQSRGDWRARLSTWRGGPLFLASLLVALAAGLLSTASTRVQQLLGPYAWIVPWRSLVEPVLVLGTALSLDRILAHLGRPRALLATLVLLVPCLSTVHWMVNADLFLRRAATLPYGRGPNRALYDDFTRYGTQVLGRTTLREPLLVPPDTAPYVRAAFGLRAVAAAGPYRDLTAPERRAALMEMEGQGEIGDVIVLSTDPALRDLQASGDAVFVTAFGPYSVLRPTGSRASANPVPSGPR
jgi:hypothetical protein